MARSSSKKRRQLFWRAALVVALALLLAVTAYVIHLDRIVTRQFEGRRWTLPAQVYAAPLELYVGLAVPIRQIEQELQRLQYRSVEQPVHAGEYHRRGTRIYVVLRRARFAD